MQGHLLLVNHCCGGMYYWCVVHIVVIHVDVLMKKKIILSFLSTHAESDTYLIKINISGKMVNGVFDHILPSS